MADAQGLRQLVDGDDRRVAPTLLQPAQVLLAEPGPGFELLLIASWLTGDDPEVPLIPCDHIVQAPGDDFHEHEPKVSVRLADRDNEQDVLVVLQGFWVPCTSRVGKRRQAETALWMLENLAVPNSILERALTTLARNTNLRLVVRDPELVYG